MDPALAARFGSSAQRAATDSEAPRASPDDDALAVDGARRTLAAVLVRIYAAVESMPLRTTMKR